MFKDRFDHILESLQMNNTETASVSELDRTYISRLRKGERVIRKGSSTAEKIAEGIVAFTENKGIALYQELGLKKYPGKNRIKTLLLDYLFQDEKEEGVIQAGKDLRGIKPAITPYSHPSGECIQHVMLLSGVSNAQLSRMINVDASLISRYRSGDRKLDPHSGITKRISEVLYKRIEKRGLLSELSDITGLSETELKGDLFLDWLCDPGSVDRRNAESARRLLNAFSSYDMDTGMILPSPEEAVSESLLKSKKDLYIGYDGFKEAILLFLIKVLKQNQPEILLYSDQDIDWLVEDPLFRMKWASLMSECVKKGVRISIIHNIDRSINEMNEAILSWLPLYMSGMIQSWYCRKKAGERFSQTIFLCPGRFSITGTNVKGTEKQGIYRFVTSIDELDILGKGMKHLFSSSLPLVSIAPNGSIPAPDKDAILIESPSFKDLSIDITGNSVHIRRLLPPELTFTFTHPLMCRAFLSYAESRGKTLSPKDLY